MIDLTEIKLRARRDSNSRPPGSKAVARSLASSVSVKVVVARFKRPPVNLLSADLEPRGRSGSSREWHGSSAQDFQPERADKVEDASRGCRARGHNGVHRVSRSGSHCGDVRRYTSRRSARPIAERPDRRRTAVAGMPAYILESGRATRSTDCRSRRGDG